MTAPMVTSRTPIPVGMELPAMEPPAPPSGKPARSSKAKGKAGERFAVLNAFVDFTVAGLSRAQIAVWLILYRDTRDGTARTAVSDLARRAGCNRATVFRALRRLEAAHLVRIVHRGGLGRGPSRCRVCPLSKEG